MSRALGRRPPPDWEHVDKYPLTRSLLGEIAAPRPIVIGINWYSNFDSPVRDRDGSWWIGRGNRGSLEGGHCVALKPRYAVDTTGWWDFYDQGWQGACVGFGTSRMLSHLNRKRYAARWLWDQAKMVDPWDDTNPGDDEGTLVRSGLDVLRKKGHVPWKTAYSLLDDDDWQARQKFTPVLSEGISAYRWVRSIPDALNVLGYGDKDYVDIINSWGRDYPHLVRMPASMLEILWWKDGEIGVPTDR